MRFRIRIYNCNSLQATRQFQGNFIFTAEAFCSFFQNLNFPAVARVHFTCRCCCFRKETRFCYNFCASHCGECVMREERVACCCPPRSGIESERDSQDSIYCPFLLQPGSSPQMCCCWTCKGSVRESHVHRAHLVHYGVSSPLGTSVCVST